MAQIAVTVNGHTYQVSCDDGQEEHVRYLADYLDQRVAGLVETMGETVAQAGEARLLLLGALLVADDLAEVQATVEELRAALESARAERDKAVREGAENAASLLNRAASRIEDIAVRLEST